MIPAFISITNGNGRRTRISSITLPLAHAAHHGYRFRNTIISFAIMSDIMHHDGLVTASKTTLNYDIR
jgi:hypothetical protein